MSTTVIVIRSSQMLQMTLALEYVGWSLVIMFRNCSEKNSSLVTGQTEDFFGLHAQLLADLVRGPLALVHEFLHDGFHGGSSRCVPRARL